MKLKIKKWEIAGGLFIICIGATLHYWYLWTDYWRPMALISPVNESTWEHLKLTFWPSIFFGTIQYFNLRINTNKFLTAKLLGILTMPILTIILFYSYTSILGRHYFLINILLFILSVVAGQYVSYKILICQKEYKSLAGKIALAGIIILIAAFSLLTYYPVKNFIFEHPGGHQEYGILENYDGVYP